MLSVGIDAALEEHQVEIQNEKEQVLCNLRIKNTRKGFEELCAKLEEIKKCGNETNIVGIFVEAIGGYFEPFRYHLEQKGYRVVVVNPLEVKSARTVKNLGKTKSDKIDAHVLASLPWMDMKYREMNTHNRYEISELTRLYQKTLSHSTRLQNCLIADVARVFPEFLQLTQDFDNKTNLALLKKYPTPSKILAASEEKLTALVKKVSRYVLDRGFVKKVRELAQNTIGIPDEGGFVEYRIKFLVERLIETKNALKELSDEIKRRTENIEEVKLIDAIRGIDRVRAASLYGEIGPINQFENERKLKGYGGITPKISASAKKKWVGGPAKTVNHYLRNTVSVCARTLPRHSDEFRAIYAREKIKGKTDTQAYVIVGNRLLYHVFSILKNKKPYRKRMPINIWHSPYPPHFSSKMRMIV